MYCLKRTAKALSQFNSNVEILLTKLTIYLIAVSDKSRNAIHSPLHEYAGEDGGVEARDRGGWIV